jgi:hypothetical protein
MRFLAVCASLTFIAATALAASAQTSPPVMQKIFPNSPGVERGLSSVNNSGQVGTATLHAIDAKATDVVLSMKGTVNGRPELAGIVRSPSGTCEAPPEGPFAYTLSPVKGGSSHSQISIGMDELLSGNYLVVVYSNEKPSHFFSCGRLYH